jgi:uncharacterized membrane protein
LFRARALLILTLAVLALRLIAGENPWTGGIAERIATGDNLRGVDFARTYGWWAAAGNAIVATVLLATARRWLTRGDPVEAAELAPPAGVPRRAFWLLVAAAVLTCGVLGHPRLSFSLWDDEETTVRRALDGYYARDESGKLSFVEARWRDTFWEYKMPNNHVPFTILSRLTLAGWRAVARPELRFVKEEVFRLPAYVAGLASLALVAIFLRRLGFWLPGICAAWLLALHPWMLRYTTEGRGYALMLALIPLTLTLWVGALHRGTWGRWLAYGAAQFLLLYTYTGTLYLLLVVNAVTALALWRLHRGTPALGQQVPRWLVVNAAGAIAWVQLMLPNMMQLLRYLESEIPDSPPRFLANVLGSLWVGLSWRVGSLGEFYPELIDMALAHPIAFRTGLAATLSLLAAGFLRLLVAGGVRALLTLILLVPGPVTYWIAAVREDRVHEWYYLFALPGLAALVALGLGWIFAWIRRPRLSTALTAAVMVAAVAGYAGWTQVPRDALRSGPLQPLRESVLLTRGTLDPFAPENDDVITTSFKRGPTYYDPLLIEIERVSQLRQLMRRTDQTGAVLYVNLGKPMAAKAAYPDLFALVEDPSAFEVVTTLYGFEPRGIRTIYRYRESRRHRLRSEASASVDADR